MPEGGAGARPAAASHAVQSERTEGSAAAKELPRVTEIRCPLSEMEYLVRYPARNDKFVLVVLTSPFDSVIHGPFWLPAPDFHHPAGISTA